MPSADTITAHELLYDLVPKLKALETMVSDTLLARLMMTTDREVRHQLKAFKAEFELERTMIRLNLEHLLRRHAGLLEAVKNGSASQSGQILPLDDHEASAVARVRQLHRKAQDLKRC